jgi:hypothetical protein
MAQNQAKVFSLIETLEQGSPPYLLKSIREGWPIEDPRKYYCGRTNSKLLTISDNICICISGINRKAMKEIELQNYVVRVPTNIQIEIVKKGIELLKSEFSEFYEIVNSNLALIVLVKSTKKSDSRFASSSYFEFPNCIFIQDLAFRYLPPNSLLPKSAVYAFLDNLLHEAVHQRIFNLDFFSAICKNYSEDLVVKIPWRQTYWSFYHAFHSYGVYVSLSEFRTQFIQRDILSKKESMIVTKSLRDVERIVKTLFTELRSHKHNLTFFGNKLLEQFKLKQDQVFN